MVTMMAKRRRGGGERVGTKMEIKMGLEVRGVRSRVKKKNKTGRWGGGWGLTSNKASYTRNNLKSAS